MVGEVGPTSVRADNHEVAQIWQGETDRRIAAEFVAEHAEECLVLVDGENLSVGKLGVGLLGAVRQHPQHTDG
jgi:hypothetical protein